MKKNKLEYIKTFKPYIVNAFYIWSLDINKTPLIEVVKSVKNKIPSFLEGKDNLVFNIHPTSVRNLIFSKDTINFEAIFNEEIYVISIHNESIKRLFHKEEEYEFDFEKIPEFKSESNHLKIIKKNN